ncbi:DUF3099 domain-containing protein [Yinghuangia sp. YIM S10712]|uniref:DUF3099 domain-containing protein n=1 Tax=Yinghuangia sp. YIM S10712 TaxID=3436930 RepID=UPI003F53B034
MPGPDRDVAVRERPGREKPQPPADGRSYRGGVRRRRRLYFALMGTCLTLFVLAWAVVRHVSIGAAVAMSVVAMTIPPVAVIIANRRAPGEKWFDE